MLPVPRPLRRRSRRDPEDLYADGHYLITVCTHLRRHTFGAVVDEELRPSPLGVLVSEAWRVVLDGTPHAQADAFVVMPNHVHAVVHLEMPDDDVRHPTDGLAGFVQRFKAKTTMSAEALGIPTPVWQRGYHDRVLRTGQAQEAAIAYVEDNPLNWHQDPERTPREQTGGLRPDGRSR